MTYEKAGRVIEFDIDFDVLDASIHRCLSDNDKGFITFDREELTRATIVYVLSQYQLGNIGRLRIDKLGNKRVMLSFFETLELLSSKQKKDFLEGRDNLIKTHYQDIIDMLFYKLGEESIWEEEDTVNHVANGEIKVGKNVVDSTLISGNNNVINITRPIPKKKRK